MAFKTLRMVASLSVIAVTSLAAGYRHAYADELLSRNDAMFSGFVLETTKEEWPATIHMPGSLLSIMEEMRKETEKTGREVGSCLTFTERASDRKRTAELLREYQSALRKRDFPAIKLRDVLQARLAQSGNSEWSRGRIVQGTTTGVEENIFDMNTCPAGAVGTVHTHPAISFPFPSDRDFANELAKPERFGIVVHKDGICILVESNAQIGDILFSREEAYASFALNAVSASSAGRAKNDIKTLGPEGIAAAAADFNAALYCGGFDGTLHKVQGIKRSPDVDKLVVKAFVIMTHAEGSSGWPPITFKFTPEFEPEFIRYVNELFNKIQLGRTVNSNTPAEGVLAYLIKIAPDKPGAAFGPQLAMPDYRDESPNVILLASCDGDKTQQLECIISANRNPAVENSRARIFAVYQAGGQSFLIDFPGISSADYKISEAVRGTGYLSTPEGEFVGAFLDISPDGEGVWTDKATGRKTSVVAKNGTIGLR